MDILVRIKRLVIARDVLFTQKAEGCGEQLRLLQAWLMRKLRCYLWKQWGTRGYRELRKRGVSRDLAWNTSKSAHGPWRLSMSPALNFALPTGDFVKLGLPLLHP